MVFTQSFAIPCLLFRALIDLDLGAAFDPGLLVVVLRRRGRLPSGSASSAPGACFGRRPGEAVAIGFGALVLELGAARAADHGARLRRRTRWRRTSPSSRSTRRSATCSASRRWSSPGPTAAASPAPLQAVARAMFRNALMIGLALGFAVNLVGPAAARHGAGRGRHDGRRGAARGAVRARRRAHPLRDRAPRSAEAGMIAALSLVLHPAIACGARARRLRRCRASSCARPW